ncbi:MAG: DNA topoisomerase (ATP-hydrolyzing) subunit A [Proteobacteria bacterium]|nr:DNA topoisomerase (ATP-hydrolyzing) subunit A [Pseudomonadota bacterium]MDA1135932.1 DNA topoisomerase (ATP-hydrolyzing) subunit A [Pseudomonadota bacterium]
MTEENNDKPINHSIISITDEMKKSYLDYAMSVIVSRALPDVRDGLKPVHRRILYAMIEGGYDWSKAYRKSARVVGDVMGNYHPHGDTAIYDAMVRMAQDFSMRLMLVDGQGNFGSVDGDPPAAMRYTESRLAKSSENLLRDIDKDTVDFIPNYDESQSEPSVLPAEFPNMLVNGASGIAVGMATNIPPHNPGEVIRSCKALIDNPDLSLEELMEIIPGPDFPTSALIMGRSGIREAFRTGRGSVIMRSRAEIVQMGKNSEREMIVITEIPFQVNKALVLERLGELVRDKTIEGISDLRDESDRNGMRMVIEIKRDFQADVVLNQLWRHTRLQTSFPVNMLALDNGRPKQMGLIEILKAFIEFRFEIVVRRTKFLLNKSRNRAHILAGLMVAITSIDEIIDLIKSSSDPESARKLLCSKSWPAKEVERFIKLIDDPNHLIVDDHYFFSEIQAKAILELRLQRLTGMERSKLEKETNELSELINEYLIILSDKTKLTDLIQSELSEVLTRLDDPRRTEINDSAVDQDDEDLIQKEDMVVTVSHRGYIKRVSLSTYRAQRRGGKGRAGMKMRDEDTVTSLFVINTHTPILFFTSSGVVYQLKCYKLPESAPQALGKPMINLLPINQDEKIHTIMPMPENEDSWKNLQIIFATKNGNIRRNQLSDFTNIRQNGKIAMKLNENDELVSVITCGATDNILLATKLGKAIRFDVNDVRVFVGRDSSGVRGIRLKPNDFVVSMSLIPNLEKRYILSVTENGFGKRTSIEDYRMTNRGGQGVANIECSTRNGPVVSSYVVSEDDQIMLVTNSGKLIRIRVNGGEGNTIRVAGRNTQGVRLFDVDDGEKVVSVALLTDNDEDEDEDDVDDQIIDDNQEN